MLKHTPALAAAKEYCAGTLWSLSVQSDYQVFIAQQGAIPPLVSMLKDGSQVATAKENAAATLRNVALIDENKLLLVRESMQYLLYLRY